MAERWKFYPLPRPNKFCVSESENLGISRNVKKIQNSTAVQFIVLLHRTIKQTGKAPN